MSRGTERYDSPYTPETETCPITDFDDLVKVSPSLANEISNAVVFEVIGADTEADGARLLLEALIYHSKPSERTIEIRANIQERLDEIAVNFDGLLLMGGETNNVKRYNDAYAMIPDNEYYRLSRNAKAGPTQGKINGWPPTKGPLTPVLDAKRSLWPPVPWLCHPKGTETIENRGCKCPDRSLMGVTWTMRTKFRILGAASWSA